MRLRFASVTLAAILTAGWAVLSRSTARAALFDDDERASRLSQRRPGRSPARSARGAPVGDDATRQMHSREPVVPRPADRVAQAGMASCAGDRGALTSRRSSAPRDLYVDLETVAAG